ncbi:DNA replication protein [Serratia liquefaciens]|uniref:DNA replication protein n=1 Tax=Serratia liquefaciens TaxID=614 RepID=UPI0039059FE0
MSNVLRLSDFRGAEQPMEKPQPIGQGLVFLHRKIMELPFYRTDFEAMHLWVHLILKVNSAPGLVATELGEQPVGRGQVITGRNTLAKETGLESDRVQYLLRKLEKLGMISCLSNRKFTLITVTKYDEYQGLNCMKNDQKSYQPNYQEDYQAKPATGAVCGEGVTNEIIKLIPTNNINTNNSIPNGIECATGDKKTSVQKAKISCEEVWQCLKDELPEARGWRVMDDRRRNLIRTFWGKANKIARQLDNGQPLTMQGFREYLQYISRNCRWMLEDRPDIRTGKTWRRMKFDSFLSATLYLEVREGDRDDA